MAETNIEALDGSSDGLIPIGPDDEIWNRAGWLDEFREPPIDATWPRLMSAPHPLAVGSYGPEVAESARSRTGLPLRYWQRLALARVLEHDAAGELVWPYWIGSTARQVGKSWMLRELFVWRIDQGERFGEPQLVLHTGKDLPVCREIQRPARVWARSQDGWTVREANGMEEIETPDGSRWIIRGKGSIYGYSASLAGVDEAWKVAPEIVEDGLEPTMAERASSQLALLSTAHRMATPLVPTRRAGAIEQLGDPSDTLLLEWSAAPDVELDDRLAWRQASPHWMPRRERLIDAQYRRARVGAVSDDPDEPDPVEAFRSQWLNIWPAYEERTAVRLEPLLEDGVWTELASLSATADGRLVVAIEDYFGRGAAVAAAGRTNEGRLLVWGRAFGQRSAARTFAASLLELHPGSQLVIGSTLREDDELAPLEPLPATAATTRAGLARLVELVGDRALIHDGGADLASQMATVRVSRTNAGYAIWPHGGRADLVRAAAWAALIADRAGEIIEEPAIY